jgi:hypothetical protein
MALNSLCRPGSRMSVAGGEVDRKTCALSEPYRFWPKMGIIYGGWKLALWTPCAIGSVSRPHMAIVYSVLRGKRCRIGHQRDHVRNRELFDGRLHGVAV